MLHYFSIYLIPEIFFIQRNKFIEHRLHKVKEQIDKDGQDFVEKKLFSTPHARASER